MKVVKRVKRDRHDHIVNLAMLLVLFWSFDGYWIGMSGWSFLWQAKLVIGLIAFPLYYIYLRVELARWRHYKNQRKTHYRNKIMLKHTIRNLKDPA